MMRILVFQLCGEEQVYSLEETVINISKPLKLTQSVQMF